MKKNTLFFCLFLSVVSGAYGQKNILTDIQKALKDSIVTLEVSGAYGGNIVKRYLDFSGVHYGECMAFKVKNKSRSNLEIQVPAGLKLESDDPGVQNMYVTKSFVFSLGLEQEAVFKTYAMCGEIHDQIPHDSNFHTVGKVATGQILKIIRQIEVCDQQNKIGQHALWAVTDNVSEAGLKSYGANEFTFQKTVELLKLSGANCRILRAESQNSKPLAGIMHDTVLQQKNDTIVKIVKSSSPPPAGNASDLTNYLMLFGGVIAGLVVSVLLKRKPVKVSVTDQ